MAYSYIEYTGDGLTQTFNVPFTYASQSEIIVYVNGAATTAFTFTSSSTIAMATAPANGSVVRVGRTTNLTSRAVDFINGSVLSEEDLDRAFVQVFNAAQEAVDKSNEALFKTPDGKWDGQNYVIKNVADPVNDQDVVNKRTLVYQYPKVQTVADNVSSLNTVAASQTKVNTVSDHITQVDNVHDNMVKVTNLHNNMAKIVTLDGNMAKITVLDANIVDINTVADHINDVNSYAATYYISPTTPTGTIPVGAQWFNTTNNIKYIRTSTGAWSPFDSTVHTEFIGLKVTNDGNLIVTRAQGDVATKDFDEWFFGLSDATFTIDTNGNFKVSY